MNLTYLEIDHDRSHYDALTGSDWDEFLDRLILGWLYHDHALEGVVITGDDIDRALSGQPCRNYCDGLVQKSLCRLRESALMLFDAERRPEELTMEWIKELHCHFCDPDDEVAGRYRQRDTSPGVYNLDVAPQNSISYYFHKFMDMWNDEIRHYHPVRAAAIAHWEFMHVFPFDQRSGVVGRVMMNWILVRGGYPPAIIHAMDRHHYFAALDGHRTDLIGVLVDAIRSTIEAARLFSERRLEAAEDARGHQLAL